MGSIPGLVEWVRVVGCGCSLGSVLGLGNVHMLQCSHNNKNKIFFKKRDREVWTDLEVLFHDDVVEGRQLFGAEGSDKP